MKPFGENPSVSFADSYPFRGAMIGNERKAKTMELKKITYSGIDTDDVTQQMEEGNDKLAEKGWREYRVDMLSSSTVRVTYARGEEDEEGEEALGEEL